MIAPQHLIAGLWLFVLGATLGSFLNVCIYRIPWQKSVVWPGSHCPHCLNPIAARDNIPVLSWLLLRGECRHCGQPIAPRYALIEAFVGLLFVGTYLVDVVLAPEPTYGLMPYYRMGYHLLLALFLVAATFIDFDLYIIPDAVTVPGMVLGLGIGTLVPGIRPEPATAATPLEGLAVGVVGLLAGGALIWAIRIFGSLIFRREAMGFGDVTLMAMIGSFLGWRVVVPTLFLAAFLGLVPSLGQLLLKFFLMVRNWLTGRRASVPLGEIPFGPYLSLAALILMLGWPWIWSGWLGPYYESLRVVFWFLLTGDPGPAPAGATFE